MTSSRDRKIFIEDQIKTLIENNPCYTLNEIKLILILSKQKISSRTVSQKLGEHGYVWICRANRWVKNLNEEILAERVIASHIFIQRNKDDPFLKRMIIVFEKCVVYNTDLHPKKALLYIWWDWKGPILGKLISDRTTIDPDIYCSFLEELRAEINRKRPELVDNQLQLKKTIMFHDNNPRVHASSQIQEKLEQLDLKLMSHIYLPDLIPSYYICPSLINKCLTSFEEVGKYIELFIFGNREKFWERRIMSLPEKLQKVLDEEGQYCFDI